MNKTHFHGRTQNLGMQNVRNHSSQNPIKITRHIKKQENMRDNQEKEKSVVTHLEMTKKIRVNI